MQQPFLELSRRTGSSKILSITDRLGLAASIFLACCLLSVMTAAMAFLSHSISGVPMRVTGILNSTLIPFVLGAPTLYVLLTLVRRLETTRAELASLSSIDVLTGIMNRRSILAVAEQCLREADSLARSGNSGLIAIALMDVDYFKRINDRYGHLAGDEVLRQLAAVASKQLPDDCAIGRFGGEEFAVVIPGRDMETAAALAETLRAAVENHACQHQGQDIHLTVSLGVSSSSSQRAGLEDMLSQADHALYTAKGNGRNRVEVFRRCAVENNTGVNVIPL